MRDEAIGAIPADRDNHSIIPDCPSGFRQAAGGVQIGEVRIRENHVTVDIQPFKTINENAPTTDAVWDQIVDEMRKPRFAFERTFDGHRYTRRIR